MITAIGAMSLSQELKSAARAFAPASVGNIAVGFDVLGHTIAGAGDVATVRLIDEQVVRIAAVGGVVRDLPTEPERNTAGAALIALREMFDLPFGFEIDLEKGIPLGSGMGGSASSAVAALVAANALLDDPLSREQLYRCALRGEAVASGGLHGDNVGAQLLGGVVIATADELVPVPVPAEWHCVVVHPHVTLETRRAREVLRVAYELNDIVAQNSCLALFLAGCFTGDAALVRRGLRDVLVEPRRAHLIDGFAVVKQAALDHDAMGASMSGAGPSVFAWFETHDAAAAAAPSMVEGFASVGRTADVFISPVAGPRAEVID